MKKIFIHICVKLSGKSQSQLAKEFEFHYFLTRSRFIAYFKAVFA